MFLRTISTLGKACFFSMRAAHRFVTPMAKRAIARTANPKCSYPVAVRHTNGGPLTTGMQVRDPLATSSGVCAKAVQLANTEATAIKIADRIKTANISSGRHDLGVMWLYLYPEHKKARRVFKVLDRHLADALGFQRYYYPDVPFDPAKGTDGIMSDFHKEVSKQLDRRIAAADRSRRAAEETAARKTVEKPVEQPKAAPQVAKEVPTARAEAPVKQPPVQAPSPAPSPVPEVSVQAPAHKRQVAGEAFQGTITQAGMTTRHGAQGAYKSYCLTIHDGTREVPFFGAELQRQAADMGIKPGESVRIVYMGKQPIDIEGKPSSFKNLYQVTRVSA